MNSGRRMCPRDEPVRRRWTFLAASLLCLSGGAAGRALAQEQAGLSVSTELAPSGVLAQRESADLSPDERLDRAKGFVGAIERAAQSIQRDLQSARKERDVVRVLCLNDKLNQVDVALRSAQDRVSALGAAVDRKDADRARHEYTVLEVLNDRDSGWAGPKLVKVPVAASNRLMPPPFVATQMVPRLSRCRSVMKMLGTAPGRTSTR